MFSICASWSDKSLEMTKEQQSCRLPQERGLSESLCRSLGQPLVGKPLKLGSHCRSDQLDQSDHQNSPIRPDQARLKAYTRLLLDLLSITHDSHTIIHDTFTTSTRPPFRFPLDHPDLYTIPTRSQLDLLDLCSIGVRSFPDQIVMVVLES